MSDVTRILSAIEGGDRSASAQLLPLVYAELRKLAAARLAQEKPGQTLQATALVHEAYLRLVDVEQAQRWDSKGHFFAAAAEAMRRIVVENARRKASLKQGGNVLRQDFDLDQLQHPATSEDVVAIDQALKKLAHEKPEVGELVQLRFFGGLGFDEIASIMQISTRTAHRYWAYARAWLHREVGGRERGTS